MVQSAAAAHKAKQELADKMDDKLLDDIDAAIDRAIDKWKKDKRQSITLTVPLSTQQYSYFCRKQDKVKRLLDRAGWFLSNYSGGAKPSLSIGKLGKAEQWGAPKPFGWDR